MSGGRIIGIHVAGAGERGAYCTVVTDTMLQKCLEELDPEPAAP